MCEMVFQHVRYTALVKIAIGVLDDDVINWWFITDYTIKDYYIVSNGTQSLWSGAMELFTFSYSVLIVNT